MIGVIGLALSDNGSIGALQGSGSETVIIEIASLLSQNGWFLAIIAGIILSGILASTMSTADSQLLAAASAISQDIMVGTFKLKVTEKTKMIAARLTCIAIAVLGVVFAWDPDSSVFRIVSFAWAGFGAAFGPLVLFSLFWKRTNKAGAVAGMVTGGAMVFIWKYIIAKLSPVLNIYELLPAFILSSLAIVAVSLLTKAPDKSITDEFDAVKAMQ